MASSIATGRDLVTAPGSPPQTRPPDPQLGPPRLSSGVFQAVRVITGSSRGGSGRRRSARGRAPRGPCGRGLHAEPAPRWLQPRAPRPRRSNAHDGHAAPAVPGPPPPSRGPVDLERLPGSGRGSQARECPLLPAAPGPGGGTRALVPPAGLGPGAAGGPAGPSGALARTEPARALPSAARALSHAVNGAAGDRVPLELRAPRVLSVRVSQCDPVAPTRPSQLPGPGPCLGLRRPPGGLDRPASPSTCPCRPSWEDVVATGPQAQAHPPFVLAGRPPGSDASPRGSVGRLGDPPCPGLASVNVSFQL